MCNDAATSKSDFAVLVADLRRILDRAPSNEAADINVDALINRLKQYTSVRSHWNDYAYFDPDVNYTRNGVDTLDSRAELLVLVWTPGKGSDVHDHGASHCVVKVLEGTLRETLYDQPAPRDPLKVHRVTDYGVGEVSYMSDNIGLHRMENVGTVPAVSLHLYTPPNVAKTGFNVYTEGGAKHHVARSTLYSDKGFRIDRGEV